jgi:hypothetical protein
MSLRGVRIDEWCFCLMKTCHDIAPSGARWKIDLGASRIHCRWAERLLASCNRWDFINLDIKSKKGGDCYAPLYRVD